MTKQEFDLKYRGEKVAVHCDTEEKAEAFLKLAKSFGYTWCNGRDLEETTNWRVYKNLTIYTLDGIRKGFMTFGSINGYVKDNNYKIIPFELDEPNGYAIEDTPSPMKETFNINDMVYSMPHKKYGRIVQINYIVEIDGKEETLIQAVVHKQKPLKEITEKELADMGYVLKK